MAIGTFSSYGNNPLKRENTFIPNKAYPAAIEQQAGDYSDIMNRYKSIADRGGTEVGNSSTLRSAYGNIASSSPYSFNAISPVLSNYSAISTPTEQSYSPSRDVTSSMERLRGLADTGGYSEGDISNLRARAVSPIRSIYSSAQRGLDRTRALSGGYSPGYAGAAARMAREQSESIGGALTNVNAGIAEAVASGRRAIAPSYASFAGSESRAREGIEGSNVAARNRIAEINAARQADVETSNIAAQNRTAELNTQRQLDVTDKNLAARSEGLSGLERVANADRSSEVADQNRVLQATQGMQSLYGTTPALASVYGNQALQTEQLARQPISRSPLRRRYTGGMNIQAPGRYIG